MGGNTANMAEIWNADSILEWKHERKSPDGRPMEW